MTASAFAQARATTADAGPHGEDGAPHLAPGVRQAVELQMHRVVYVPVAGDTVVAGRFIV